MMRITSRGSVEGTSRSARYGSRGYLWFLVAPLCLIAVTAIAAPWLPLPAPSHQDLAHALQPPVWLNGNWAHPLGTDSLGRDVLSRMAYGARLSLAIGVGSVLISGVFGSALGIVAGYRGGWADVVVSRLVDAQLALPVMLLALSIIGSRGHSITVLLMVLAISGWAQYARVVRAEALKLRGRTFVMSLRASGFSTTRIMVFHILPNAWRSMLVIATLQVGAMITGEGALSFLGLGVVAPDVSWGLMLADGRDYLTNAWWVVTFPGLAIAVVVLLTSLLGDWLSARPSVVQAKVTVL